MNKDHLREYGVREAKLRVGLTGLFSIVNFVSFGAISALNGSPLGYAISAGSCLGALFVIHAGKQKIIDAQRLQVQLTRSYELEQAQLEGVIQGMKDALAEKKKISLPSDQGTPPPSNL